MTRPRHPFRFPALALFVTSCAGLLLTLPAKAADTTTEPIPPQLASAVDRGIQWLANHQDPATGQWSVYGASEGPTAAVTSLATMAIMARGNVPGQGPYGETINRAVDAILHLQQPSGLIAAPGDRSSAMYEHGISTVMLCETYGMLDEKRQPLAAKAIGKAVALILAAQSVPKPPEFQGGWRYTPNSGDSDISVTGWQLMALRGAANIGAQVPKRAIDQGIAYIRRRAVAGGGFSYLGNSGPNAARTGTGILALELLGKHHSPESLAGGDFLQRFPPTADSSTWYYYSVYYCAQAAWQLGGDYWTNINSPLRQSLLDRQNLDGSWTVDNLESRGGDTYATSMAILALTVPYRYLPIYQR